ncbi:response regulator [Actinoplanes sp. KI2]|uniref:response regulator transcription factor n=1 Tax=Actinoplanes sp. KI2 TaxID=2983315 RepID=UPI0021D5DABE|nr:response regulator [Actinoplanes sp. KI2]MCU7728351.1 response regulator [Actinoplanes sp. KI2]
MAKVLVVDDDPAICRLLMDVLELDGHEVHVAIDGAHGVQAYMALRPDFVVLDVMMPRLDGYGVLREIRAMETARVPVLLLTALPDCSSRGRASGADYFLAKPFTADEVLYLIDGVLGHNTPIAEVQAAVDYARGQGYSGQA